MKKSLLALAVLGAFAGAASAQTNVTIYGIVDAGISRVDTNTGPASWQLSSGNQSGSRLGFRGTEDLGGGLSAIFTLENGFNVDDGSLAQGTTAAAATATSPAATATTRLFGRQAFVGLSGGFGALKFGRQNNPIFNAQAALDPFGTGFGGSGAMSDVFPIFGFRMDNTVNYSMPTMGGLTGEIAYGFGEVPGATSDSQTLGGRLSYNGGPVHASLSFHRQDFITTTTTGDASTLILGGVYNFGVAKLHAAISANDADAGATRLARSRDAMIGLTVPVGPAGNILASYIRHDQRSGTGAVGGSATAVDADYAALGYTHSISKRTNLYTTYGRLNRKPAGAVDATRFNVGVRHTF